MRGKELTKGTVIEVVDEVKLDQMEKWYEKIGFERASEIWVKAEAGELSWEEVYRQAFKVSRVSKRQAELIAHDALVRFLEKRHDRLNRLLEAQGLGLSAVFKKLKELLEAYRLDTYRGTVTVDPNTGLPIKLPDNPTRMKALELLAHLHNIGKQQSGPQVAIYINAAPIQKPAESGAHIEVTATKKKSTVKIGADNAGKSK